MTRQRLSHTYKQIKLMLALKSNSPWAVLTVRVSCYAKQYSIFTMPRHPGD